MRGRVRLALRAEQRAFIERTTPYQNLTPGENFPTVFIYTSTKDDRVPPGHARKYGARLTELGVPYLYYGNTDGGQSANANLREVARRQTREYMYLTQWLIDRAADTDCHTSEKSTANGRQEFEPEFPAMGVTPVD